MNKLAKPGYRVQHMYVDDISGTIVGRVDELNVIVAWDTPTQKFQYGVTLLRDAEYVDVEQVKFLRKGDKL